MSRALAAQPGARFASVDEFAARLQGAVVRPLGKGAWIPRLGVKASLLAGAAGVVRAAAGVVLFANRGRAIDPRRVVVTGFEDLTGDPALASLGHMAADWVTQELARSGAVEVVPAVGSGHLDVAAVEALATKTSAGTVVAGSYYKRGASVRLQVQIVDAARGTVRRVLEPVGAPLRTPIDAADVVRRRVAAAFDTLFASAAGPSRL